mgnify:CR=1 FL=1
MYEWRKMTPKQREATLKLRKQRGYPWHSPPHLPGETNFYHITAACYEHKSIIGTNPKRMYSFVDSLLKTAKEYATATYAWCVLSNHYHIFVQTDDLKRFEKELGKLHGRNSYNWNGEENCRGRKVWYNMADRYIRSERHFWTTVNYIHNNPVHHGYIKKWQEWPFSSAIDFIRKVGREKAIELWREYPLKNYGKGWDDPHL